MNINQSVNKMNGDIQINYNQILPTTQPLIRDYLTS